jgi:hypothetical protein
LGGTRMIKCIVNACPFAPGAVKPASMAVPRTSGLAVWKRLVNRKSTFLVLSFVSLMLLYGYSYPSRHYPGTPFMYEESYFLKMSLYTYVSGMLGFYIKKYKRRN